MSPEPSPVSPATTGSSPAGAAPPPSRARLVTPLDDNDVGRLLDAAPPRGVIARGLGRSYGDAR